MVTAVAASPTIVSLVPSLTEALVEWGAGERLLARTRYCIEPAGRIGAVEAVGGTKNPDVERIVALAPDLVVVNKEENRIEDCQRIEQAGIALHVTHPRTVADAASMLEELAAATGLAEAAAGDVARAHAAVAANRAAADGLLAFCPIWRRPWMTFSDDTYIGDVLARAGCTNVFGATGQGDFFEVALADVVAADLDVVVLPDEPYVFAAEHAAELAAAGVRAPAVLVDGKDLAWYGPRIGPGLARLRRAIAEAAVRP